VTAWRAMVSLQGVTTGARLQACLDPTPEGLTHCHASISALHSTPLGWAMLGVEKLEGDDDSAITRRVAQGLRSVGENTPLDELRRWRESCSFALVQLFGHQSSKVFVVPPPGRSVC
jgi:hypothetical protein